MRQVVAVLATMMSCLVAVCQSVSQPVTSLDLSQPLAVTSTQALTVGPAEPTAPSSPLEPLYRINLSPLIPHWPGPTVQGAIVFLTEHTLAVAMCIKAACNLATFDLADGKPRQIGRMDDDPHYQAILRGRDGGVVLSGVRSGGQAGVVLLDPYLQNSHWTPRIAGVSPGGKKIPDGPGHLLDQTANAAAYLYEGMVRILGSDGKLLGSFDAGSPGGNSILLFRFLGQDRLLFPDSGSLAVRDYHGKVLRRLRGQDQRWGVRIAESADGDRLLLDSLTRHVGLAQSIKEKALVLPTMGMSTDGDAPNGETVRVIDTQSGKQCFEWKGGATFLPRMGSHADIDPSGRLVAIVMLESLVIYRLPDACGIPPALPASN